MSGMSVWKRLLRVLGIVDAEVEVYAMEEELAKAIHFLGQEQQRSEQAVAAEMVGRALNRHAMVVVWRERWETLSPREKQVATLVGGGYSNAEIATALGVKRGTIKTQLSSVLRKFDIHSREEVQMILEALEEADR